MAIRKRRKTKRKKKRKYKKRRKRTRKKRGKGGVFSCKICGKKKREEEDDRQSYYEDGVKKYFSDDESSSYSSQEELQSNLKTFEDYEKESIADGYKTKRPVSPLLDIEDRDTISPIFEQLVNIEKFKPVKGGTKKRRRRKKRKYKSKRLKN
jgi:hypothetical protein